MDVLTCDMPTINVERPGRRMEDGSVVYVCNSHGETNIRSNLYMLRNEGHENRLSTSSISTIASENAIAIENEARDPNSGNVFVFSGDVYVTMQIINVW